MAAKKSKSLREKLTDSIMKNKYGDDDPKYDQYDQDNLNFLNTLSILELECMCEEVFDDEGEVNESNYCFDCQKKVALALKTVGYTKPMENEL